VTGSGPLIKGDIKVNDGVFDVKQAHKLDNPGRIKDLRPQELLKEVALIETGDTCIDFGSGTGVFAIPMADMAGSAGRVYAVDNSLEMLGHIKAKNPPQNLVLVQSGVVETGLDNGISDLCLLAFILHEIEEPGKLIAEALRLLKPEGRLVIVDWNAELDSPGPPRKVRISKEQIVQLFEGKGLTLVKYVDWSQNYYIAVGEIKK
jgi:ubiquinone/menaquinone biosynthesis C-methylase UbiE